MVELPHIISSHFQGKSSFRCPNKIEMKKWRTDKFLLASLPHEIAIDKGLDKYWHKRFALFSLYDFGIKMDRGTLITSSLKKLIRFEASHLLCINESRQYRNG